MKEKTIVILWISTGIIILEAYALYLGYNSHVFLSAIGILAGLFGYYLGKKRNKNEATSKGMV